MGGIEVGALYATLKLNRDKFDESVRRSGVSLTGLAKVAVASGAIIAGALVGASVVGTKFADDYGRASARVAAITGLSITEASKLVAVFQRYGMDGQAAIRTIGMLEKNVGTLTLTTKSAAKFQDQFGFSLKDSSGKVRDAGSLIGEAADYFNNKSIPASQKATLEAKLFGRQWQSLVPILALGSKGIKDAESAAAELGLVLTKQNAAELADYRKATIETDEAMGGLKLQIGLFVMPAFAAFARFLAGTLIPGIRSIFGSIKEWVAANQPLIASIGQVVGAIIGGLVGAVGIVIGAIGNIAAALAPLGDLFGTVFAAISDVFTQGGVAVEAFADGPFGQIGSMVNSVARAFAAAAAQIGPALTAAFGAAVTWIGQLADSFRSFATAALPVVTAGIQFIVDALKGIVDAIAPVLANGEELKGLLVIIGGVVAAVVVPPFLAWAAATIAAVSPLLLVAAAVAGVILVLEHFGVLGPVVEAITRTVGEAFDWVATNVVPALQAAFEILTTAVVPAIAAVIGALADTVIPALGAGFSWIATNIIPPVATILGTLTTVIFPALSAAIGGVVSFVAANLPTIRAIFQSVAGGVGAAVHAIATVVSAAFHVVAAVIHAVAPVIVAVGKVVFPALAAAATVLLTAMSTVFHAIGVVWDNAWNVAQVVAAAIGNVWTGLTGVMQTVWNGITGIVKGAANILIGIVNAIIGAVDSIQVHIGRIGMDTPVGWVGVGPFDWNGLNIGQIPYLAGGTRDFAGGLAHMNELGPETAILPRGTRVLTADETRRNESPTVISFGDVHMHGVGSDVSLPAARRFGQAVLDEVATGLEQQSARLSRGASTV